MRAASLLLLLLTLLVLPGCIMPRAVAEAESWKKLGLAYIHDRNDPAAISELRRSVKRNHWDEEAWQLLGLAYFSAERFDDAEASFLRALRIKPDFAQAQVNLGSLYLATDRFKDAVAILEQAVENAEYREPARAKHNLAYAWYAQGEYGKARELYISVLRAFPAFCPGLHGLGTVDEAEGRLPDALARYKQALECDPRDLKVHLNLGSVEARLDLVSDACQHLTTVKDADPYGEFKRDAEALLDRLDCSAVGSL